MSLRSRLAGVMVLAGFVAGCSNLPYYLQSVAGQLDIWSRQQDIESVIASNDTEAPLREKLRTVLSIREFASAELALPRNASYRTYANLGRRYAVWNVFATPEFSLKPRRWCFIFAGCVNYRGYFDKAEADAFAAGLAEEGLDAFVGGVPAYSLLGYFPDPVLNTFIHYPTPHLARLMFHELAHQVVYVRDDSVFNESFAVTVEHAGLLQWLARFGTEKDRETYALITQRREGFLNLIETYRKRLEALYQTPMAPDVMRAEKAAVFAALNADYLKLKESWGGFAGYDQWFARPPSNALLASVGIYTRRVPAFQALLAREGGDLERFYTAVKALARLSKPERTAALESLMSKTATASAH